MSEESERLIITGSFNGLLDRVARISFFDVWFELKSTMREARKQKTEATTRMTRFCALTNLTADDVQMFASLHLIESFEGGVNPVLSVPKLLSLILLLEGCVKEGMMLTASDSPEDLQQRPIKPRNKDSQYR